MLIEFRVANFRSIREEQTFSLVASNADKDLPQNVIYKDLPGLAGLSFLKGAAVYGANASGKSNLFEAVRFLSTFVTESANADRTGEPTGVTPFKLDKDSEKEPSEFGITFVADGVRYEFRLSITTERVVEETLTAFPKGRAQQWYRRTFDDNSNEYQWARPATAFDDDKDLRKKTRENSLFLSVGPQFNHAQLTSVFNWFRNNLQYLNLGPGRGLDHGFTARQIMESRHRNRLLQILKSADIGISDAIVEEETMDFDESPLAELPPAIAAALKKELGTDSQKYLRVVLLHHAANQRTIPLDFASEESAGTQRFFSLIGPWLDILENGLTVFIDEIETSLHPLLVRELLSMVLNNETNPKGAQIIFTTHSPMLLDTSLLRRDQIWFTEKSTQGQTTLYPLTDYSPRKNEALAKGYLAGRYGGIPFIPDGLEQ